MLVRIFAVAAAVVVAASAYYLAQPVADPAPGGQAQPTTPSLPSPSPPPQVSATPVPPPPTAAATTPPPAPVPTTTATPEQQRIARRLERVLERAKLRKRVGVAVLDSQGGLTFSHRADAPVLPASTQKLTVAAAALARLGPQHRYTTTVTAARGPTAAGVVRGDVVLVGGADPALGQPVFSAIEPDRPRTPLEQLVRQVKRSGVRRITGRIVGDPNALAHEPIAAGWPPRYFDQLDATRISGLTVDAGRTIYRSGGGLQARAADDPAQQAARVFRRLLAERGVKVAGRARVAPSATQQPVRLGQVSSPPLGRILRYTVQRSDNHFADTVFRTLGASAGDSTWIGSAQATADALGPLQLDWTDVVLADGSGLSRSNSVSALFLAQLHSHMWSSNLHDQWVDLLAVSGRSGTLRSRLSGTVGAGRLFGKTGSLRDVVSLVGTVVGTKGRLAHLAVVGNDLSSTTAMREVTDRAALVLAEELQDCRRIRPPPKRKGKNKGEPRPVRLVCG
jgi:D-alanyl-D-alanine carboxypeptidase/D-alanyl-D-alanine-endopeptidase (penicillin-binding protein 4)